MLPRSRRFDELDELDELERRVFSRVCVGFLMGALLAACASAAPATGTKKKSTPVDPGDEYFDEDVTSSDDGLTPTNVPVSGAFGAAERPAPKDSGGPTLDGGTDGGPVTKTYCDGPLKAGDLQVDELLLSSRAGSSDAGEWVEIRSTRTCWLKLEGVTVDSPRGAAPANVLIISEDFELGPKEAFVVAGSADPLKNNALPGKVFAWDAVDVLKNDGDAINVKLGATVIDTLVYPAFSNLVAGRTLSFPSDCPTNVRGDWARWSLSFNVWKPGFKGTPNRANDDVACF